MKFKHIISPNHEMIHEGWDLACKYLEAQSKLYKGNVNLLTFFESHFGWFTENNLEHIGEALKSIPPEPFIAIIHDPFDAHLYINKIEPYPDCVLEIIETQCLGLYFMSQYEASKFKTFFESKGINVPCEAIYHPIKYLPLVFDLKSFNKSKNRHIYSPGMHLRNPAGLLELETPTNYTKNIIPWNEVTESMYNQFNKGTLDNINKINKLSNENYYKLYENNIFFLCLFDCVANNTILDCIDCCAPILINKSESVCEYLGHNYPLYYSSMQEANKLIKRDYMIARAHRYLIERRRLAVHRGDLFKQIKNSEIYKLI